jgi:inosine-uridine nucleoside N-ribohydrolase
MQFGAQGKPSAGVIFDADLGNTIDDALALALLYGLQGKNESRVIAVSVTKPNLKAAAFADTLVRFYIGEPGPFGGGNPAIGLATAGRAPDETPMITAVLAKQSSEGKPAYARSIQKVNDTADPVAVIRNAMSAQYDQNAIVVLAGPATNLAHVLENPEARGWIGKKVRYLCVAAGAYPNGGPELGIQADVAAAKKVFAEWPTQIIAAGVEVGEAAPFPAASIDKDFAWAPAHPVVDAYRAYKPMPYDAPATAMAAALQAVRPQEKYFKVSDPGTISVLDDGRTRFTPSADGRHRYLIPDPDQKEKLLAAYTELASGKPVPRQQRFRPPEKKKQ